MWYIEHWLLNLANPVLTLLDMFAGLAGFLVLLLPFQFNQTRKSTSFHVVLERDNLPSQDIEETRLQYFEVHDAPTYCISYKG